MSNKGKVVQVVGPVVDFKFTDGNLPKQGDAVEITRQDGTRLVFETMQHLGDGAVRTVSMESTDGLTRGKEGVNTGKPISVPVGKETLGRIMNVTGDPIDFQGDIICEEKNMALSSDSNKLFESLFEALFRIQAIPQYRQN